MVISSTVDTDHLIYALLQGTKIEQSLLKELMGNIDGYFGEYGLEMKAIADYFGLDLGMLVTLNLSYELRRVCETVCNNGTCQSRQWVLQALASLCRISIITHFTSSSLSPSPQLS